MGDLGSRQARFALFDVSHYKAIDGAAIKELDLVLAKNGLGKVDRMMLRLLVMLGREEAKQMQMMRKAAKEAEESGDGKGGEAGVAAAKFQPHDLVELARFVEENKAMFPEEAEALGTYLAELDIDQIVTPVRAVSEYLQGDLMSTEPTFLSELSSRWGMMDVENRIMSNTPKTSATSWGKWGVVMAVVVGIVAVIGIGVSEGWFESVGSLIPELDGASLGSAFNPMSLQVPSVGQVLCDEASIMNRYATPLDLKIAVESGSETCDLPDAVVGMLNDVELPQVVSAVPAAEGGGGG